MNVSSDSKIYFNSEEQKFLKEMLETENIQDAVDRFAALMAMERADPGEMKEYLRKIMQKVKQ